MAAGAAFAQTTLLEVTVEAKKAAKKSTPPKKAADTGAVAAPKASVPQVAETATSPVKGYVAERSATGTKTDTPLKETPASISVVGAEQMRDQGVQNIQEAVRYTPGVLADGFGYDSRNDYSVIRGTPAAYYVNGLRRTYGYWAHTSMIEPYALERVEVLRGPASMLYGQTPAGGIMNAISKLPQAVAYNEVSLEYGSYNHKALKVDSTGPLTTDGKWLYRITGLTRNADTQVDFVENDRYMIQPSITYKPNLDTTVTLLVNLRKDDTGSTQQFLPAQGTLTPVPGLGRVPRDTFVGNPGDYHRVEEQSVALMLDHKFSSALSIHHGMRYTHTDVAFDSTYPLILTRPRIDTLNLLGFGLDPAASPFYVANSGLLPRVRSIEQDSTNVLNSDTYLTANLQTGATKHKVTAGFDYMRYSTDRQALSMIDSTPFNIFNPTPGVPAFYFGLDPLGLVIDPSNIPPGRKSGQVQTQMGVYLQDQIKMGPWIALLGVRQDWLTIDPDNAASQ
ncbi:MAG: TonB-dependent receptor plug domain-containing protein, partial [Hyphomicrobiaceae bacterium]